MATPLACATAALMNTSSNCSTPSHHLSQRLVFPTATSKAPPRLQSLPHGLACVGLGSTTGPLPIHPSKEKSSLLLHKFTHEHRPVQQQRRPGRRPCVTFRISFLLLSCKSSSPSLYSILGVEQTVAIPEIKQAFRKLALRYHPDVCAPAGSADQGCTEKFLQLQNAYRVLCDPELRADYDCHLTNSFQQLYMNNSTKSANDEDRMVRASWKLQWEEQIQNLRSRRHAPSAEQDSYCHRSTWGSRMRQKNVQN